MTNQGQPLEADERPGLVHAGQVIYIPPAATQHIEKLGTLPLKFLCIVDPAWRQEDEEVL